MNHGKAALLAAIVASSSLAAAQDAPLPKRIHLDSYRQCDLAGAITVD